MEPYTLKIPVNHSVTMQVGQSLGDPYQLQHLRVTKTGKLKLQVGNIRVRAGWLPGES